MEGKKLKELLNKHRSSDGKYDCITTVSRQRWFLCDL